jgi:hypothetical protein
MKIQKVLTDVQKFNKCKRLRSKIYKSTNTDEISKAVYEHNYLSDEIGLGVYVKIPN